MPDKIWVVPPQNTPGNGFINISFSRTPLVRAGIYLYHAPDKIKKAISLAVNRSLENFKTVSIRETAEKYFTKQKDIRSSITLKRSYGGQMHGLIISRGHRQPLTKFAFTPKSTPTKPGSFRGAVKQAGGLKPIPLAFLINRHGNKRAFIRDDKSLRMLMSPSIPQMMKNKNTVNEAEKSAREVFNNRLEHELKRVGILL